MDIPLIISPTPPAPQILVPDTSGYHNLSNFAERLEKAKTYKDLSTLIMVPTIKPIYPRVLGPWMNLARPMNQDVVGPVFLAHMEVGDAYQVGVEMVLAQFPAVRYLLTLEHDNAPPATGLLQLYESIEAGGEDARGFDVVGGLYWTKGELGQPMVYGDMRDPILNFRPQIPQPDTVQVCNGLGMGFTLFRLELFRRIPKPWFQTVQAPGQCFTQDLYFFEKARRHGARIGCDTRVRVGHYDADTDRMW